MKFQKTAKMRFFIALFALVSVCFFILSTGCSSPQKKAKAPAHGATVKIDPPAAAKTPRDAVEAFIKAKAAVRQAQAENSGQAEMEKAFFTSRARTNLDDLRAKSGEFVLRTDNISKSRAEVLTKEKVYFLDTETAQPASKGEYIERLYMLELEDGGWKIANILTRRRGPDEFEGFVPKWNPEIRSDR